ncbi:hypothetical protein Avbf_00699 [Armadillidium vulgare]|nr:hypothetical protein Avbf_00699 [Armadillidium vulgare]
MITASTPPSPVKASYSREDLEAAALALIEVSTEEVSHPSHHVPHDNNSSPISDSSLGGPLGSPKASGGDMFGSSCATSSVVASGSCFQPQHSFPPPMQVKKQVKGSGSGEGKGKKMPLPSPSPLVSQLMEMGFARNSVEQAIKSGSVDDSHLSPESVVVWLIEHAESTTDPLFPVESVDSDADSLTDEFADEIPQLEVSTYSLYTAPKFIF